MIAARAIRNQGEGGRPAAFPFLVLLGLLLTLAGCGSGAPSDLRLGGTVMGTTWSARLDEAPAGTDWQAVIQGQLDAVDAALSTWSDASEISAVNAAEAGSPTPFGVHGQRCFALARRVASASGGAFDPTVQPLVARWGFGRERDTAWPPADEIEALRERIGWRKIWMDADGLVHKEAGDVQLDFSAVAKGYAADVVAVELERRGCTGALIEVGGEIRVFGARPGGGPWRVGLEAPASAPDAPRTVRGVLALPVDGTLQAVATSGTSRNFRTHEGRRYSHVLDPRTGYPVEHATVSVTVLGPDCGQADAWATALLVLGPDEGLRLAAAQGLEAQFLVAVDDSAELLVRATPDFGSYLTDD